ncbi:MAG TPA: NUDIX hydrolase [Anaerolineales bacterium]|nr:NUDIX hydrolase [Anaerolineales bacterium]HNN12466.1 NUDIX hydrolase [Anaerolineales bacterium]HNO32218.1 NUDIX hydrolase [Anaerolineales bacterium]
MPHIRPIAICVFRNHNRILVFEGYDPAKEQYFYRPLGGGIEYGEHSQQTVAREIKEELGAEVRDLRYLGAVENIFTFNGKTGHEIVQIYDGIFVDPDLYHRAEMEGMEDSGERFRVMWKDLDEFNSKTPLYPDGLKEMLQSL